VDRGAPSRELVLQLLTGLSHPAREKDHLARRAIYLTIPPRGSSDFSLFSLSLSLSLSLCCPSLGVQSSLRSPLRFPSLPSTRACRTRGRSPSSPRGDPRERVSVIARVSPLLLILLTAVLLCERPHWRVLFKSRRSFGVLYLSRFYVSPEVMTGPHGARVYLYLRYHRSS